MIDYSEMSDAELGMLCIALYEALMKRKDSISSRQTGLPAYIETGLIRDLWLKWVYPEFLRREPLMLQQVIEAMAELDAARIKLQGDQRN